jgi:hypothetical protein
MMTEPNNEVSEADARPTDTDQEVAETGTRPDLVWDNEVACASASTEAVRNRSSSSIAVTTDNTSSG